MLHSIDVCFVWKNKFSFTVLNKFKVKRYPTKKTSCSLCCRWTKLSRAVSKTESNIIDGNLNVTWLSSAMSDAKSQTLYFNSKNQAKKNFIWNLSRTSFVCQYWRRDSCLENRLFIGKFYALRSGWYLTAFYWTRKLLFFEWIKGRKGKFCRTHWNLYSR